MTEPRDPFGDLWRGIDVPEDDELQELARRAATEPQHAGVPTAPRRRVRARWALVGAVALLLVGSGLGFSLASSLTPSGSAGRNLVGFGFLPSSGWNVVQTAAVAPGTTNAVASKGPIRLSVTSTPRGDPALDVRYVGRELPLRIADARPVAGDRSRLHLRAGVGGYNVDARISFGAPPSAAMLAAAQRQLDRLVIAAERVTIAVRPAISSPSTNQVTVFGTIDSGKAGESITIQAKDCGTTFFRVFAGANSEAGGSWSTVIFPRITTVLRAVWNGETSNEVTFRQRVIVHLRQLSPTSFRVGPVGYGARFDDRLVTIQRFNQRLGRWEKAKVVKAAQTIYGTTFTLRVPKGTRIRAVFPSSQAGPCYVGATSPVIRT